MKTSVLISKSGMAINLTLSVISLSSILLFSCQKEVTLDPVKVEAKPSSTYVLPYNFDWEDPNLNWMPYPSNQALIPTPWVGAGSLYSTVDPDVLTDRKASDGWTLLYSNFSPNLLVYNPYFILYNKYRGLMRVFLYINQGVTATSSTYLKNGITLANNQYSILNFASQDIVDVSQKKIRVDKIAAAPSDGSSPLAPLKWYMLQYELAYDNTILPTTSSTPPQFSFYLTSIDIQQIKLGGDIQGKIKGSIGASSSSNTDIFSSVVNDIGKPLGIAGLSAIGTQFFAKNKISETQNSLGIPNSIFKAVSSGLSGALQGATGNLPGAVINILSGIFGGSSSSAGQAVSLDLSATLNLNGSIQNSTSLPSLPASYYIPGTIAPLGSGYNVQGFVPLYNQSLGVFNLNAKPKINKKVKIYNKAGSCSYEYRTNYTLDATSISLLLNPAVTNIATINNVNYEVLAFPKSNTVFNTGRIESYNGKRMISNKNNLDLTYLGADPFESFSDEVYLRVSFNVNPTNGAPTSAIVKTFAVTLVKLPNSNFSTYPKPGCAL